MVTAAVSPAGRRVQGHPLTPWGEALPPHHPWSLRPTLTQGSPSTLYLRDSVPIVIWGQGSVFHIPLSEPDSGRVLVNMPSTVLMVSGQNVGIQCKGLVFSNVAF